MNRIILSPLYFRCLIRSGVVKLQYKSITGEPGNKDLPILCCVRRSKASLLSFDMCYANVVHVQKIAPDHDDDFWYSITLQRIYDVCDL